jgi:nicotinamide mononucleotide transporter
MPALGWRWLEWVSVFLNLTYTVLYISELRICWWFAGFGAIGLAVLVLRARIYAEFGLQLFYVAMAVYGWQTWGEAWYDPDWTTSDHLGLFILSLFGSLFLWKLLRSRMIGGALPLPDAFTSSFAVGATWAMVNYVPENWFYWIAINAVSVFLYHRRGLRVASAMHVGYFVLSVVGCWKAFA